jgi:hypothetical protein
MHRERRLMDKQKIADKLLSGRYALTIAVSATFVYCAAKGIIPAEAVVGVIVLVIRDYFDRSDRGTPAGGAVA